MDSTESAFSAEDSLYSPAATRARQQEHGENLLASAAQGGLTGDVADAPSSETTPLLGSSRATDSEIGQHEGDGSTSPAPFNEFDGLPWHKRPSLYWMVGPFFVLAFAFGGIMAPKLNLIMDLVCRQYISEQMLLQPNLTLAPVDFNHGSNNDQCRIPAVSSRASILILWASVISGILSAIVSPKLGAFSDRHGRRIVLAITSCGTIVGEIIFIFAALYPQTFPIPMIIVSYALDGLTGSFILAMSISHAYATDCTPPASRNVAFGYFHGALFTALALGPIFAGYIVKLTGSIVTVFYMLTSVHVLFVIFLLFIIPESVSPARQKQARELHEAHVNSQGPQGDWINRIRALNVLGPLKTLYPTGPGTSPALRRNLFFLAAVDTVVFGVAMSSMTVIVIYVKQVFGWQTFESARFMTAVNSSRVVCLLILLPLATRLVRGKPLSHADAEKVRNTGCDNFDLIIMRLAIFLDAAGYIGYSLAGTGGLFTLSGVVAAFGGIGSPTLQSSLTKHVPAERTGQLLGAMSLLHCLARVVAPALFNAIFSATAKGFPQAVFVCLAATFGLAWLCSWMIRPGVFWDVDKANEPDVSARTEGEGQERRKRRGLTEFFFGG
jgi:MFS family permease